MYSVLETLIIRPRSFAADAVLVSWACAQVTVDSKRAMSLAKSRSFNTFADIVLSDEGVFQIQSEDLMWPSS